MKAGGLVRCELGAARFVFVPPYLLDPLGEFNSIDPEMASAIPEVGARHPASLAGSDRGWINLWRDQRLCTAWVEGLVLS
jgi:hypothetical protein